MALQLYSPGMVVSKLLHQKLTLEIGRIRKTGRVTPGVVERSNIFTIIQKELGLNLSARMINDGTENAFIPLPMLNEDHPYMQRYRTVIAGHEGVTKIKRNDGVIEGGFDKDGKAFGFFADLESSIFIGSGLFSMRYTDGETAAILCHEIGHYRGALKNLKFAFSSNHIISQAVNAYMNAGTRDERIRLVMDFEGAVGTVVNNKEELVDHKNKEMVTTVLVGSMKENGCSELNTPNLDYSQCEQEADHFATACGAGSDLSTALSKVNGYFDPSRVPRPLYYSMDLAKTIIKTSAFLAGGPITMAVMLVYVGMSPAPVARHYDKSGERIARIRKALTVESKSARLNKEEARHLVDQIETIKEVEALYKDKTPIFEMLWVNVTPWGRRDKKQTNMVKTYENLVANELHSAALKLRSI